MPTIYESELIIKIGYNENKNETRSKPPFAPVSSHYLLGRISHQSNSFMVFSSHTLFLSIVPFRVHSFAQSQLSPLTNSVVSTLKRRKKRKGNIRLTKLRCVVLPTNIYQPLSHSVSVRRATPRLRYIRYGFNNYINSLIKHYKLRIPGKTRSLIPGTERTC